ncbi:MAG: MATE family efflux transporter [Oscillospiraceae bacterium]|nr:MATE family efflux transporter [Oscillospiraceae bacterium]
MAKNNYRSLSDGSVLGVLIRFSIPFLLSGFLQMAYSSVDVFFLGKFASAAAVSGVYQGLMINAVITGVAIGLASGGTILLGQYVGAKEDKNAAKALGNLIVIAVVAAAITMGVLFAFGKGIINLMQVPVEAVGEAWDYLFVCTCGIFCVLGYNVVSSVLRSLGDSKAPFIFVLISCIANIILDYVFVGIYHMSAKGAALATVMAQGLSFVLALIYLKRKGLPFEFHVSDMVPKKNTILAVMKLGVPITLQSLLNNFSFMISSAIINTMGVYVSAAVSIVGTITGLSMVIPLSLSSSISAITAQNIGAKKPERAVKTLKYGILISLVFAIPFIILVAIWPEALVKILNNDPNVIVESVRYLYPFSWDCLFVCFVFCFNGFFNGCGKTMFAMLQEGLSAFLVRIPATYLFKVLIENATIFHVGLATPLASFASAVACLIYFRACFTKEKLERLQPIG